MLSIFNSGIYHNAQRKMLYLMALAFISMPIAAAAADKPSVGLDVTAKASSAEGSGLLRVPGLTSLIGDIIGAVLGLVGVLFFVLVIYAGFLWMTARGNPEQVSKAKNIFSGAIIGLFIIVSAYYLVDFVFGILEASVADGGGTAAAPEPSGD